MAKTLQITSDDPEWISQQIDKWQYPPVDNTMTTQPHQTGASVSVLV